MHIDSLPIITVPVPAAPFYLQLSKLQSDMGRLNAEITDAIHSGFLTATKRNQLVIRLRGLTHEAEDLAARLAVPALDETKV